MIKREAHRQLTGGRRLTAAARRKLPSNEFALPKLRKYPIPDAGHARAALARASEFATPSQRAEITRRVHRRFPKMLL